ncbi:hypothetical protein [Helicobacter canis]|uniref:D-lactate dehydrogenase n=1 Tax=Helicobacter canis TaxID=29419 RepID=A0A377J1A9_9HELI|nr:hypothetical protein [Helicobacter canis]STO96207.1 D-lactate dehydrogenase [Helicobacter canis]STO96272.1 D-lactate dehydrogenase [Helicobacter canis]
MKKVDSRKNAILASLRDTALAVAWQSINTPKADSSMDRHADKSARDDRETSKAANPNHTTQAEVFCDDFASFQGAGEGIYLGDNEQARAVESSKSAQKTTRERIKL